VQSPDDERFEAYLKQFRPLATDSLPIVSHRHVFGRWFVFAAAAAALAAVFVTAILAPHNRTGRVYSTRVEQTVGTERLVNTQSLTIRSADVLLATAPSFKAAVDEMAFSNEATQLSKDKRSVLAVLGKERTKI
jgi:hypothetical protein